MRCPACQASGLTSKIFYTISPLSPLVEGKPYYDEQGFHHDHATNQSISVFTCTLGHSWEQVTYEKACWCGWPGEIKAGTPSGLPLPYTLTLPYLPAVTATPIYWQAPNTTTGSGSNTTVTWPYLLSPIAAS